MRKQTVVLKEYGTARDAEGYFIKTWVPVCNISGNLIPITKEMASKQYGYSGNVSFEFSCKNSNSKLIEGNMINDYIICLVLDYQKAKIILLREKENNG